MDAYTKIKSLILQPTLAMRERQRIRKGLLNKKFGNSEKLISTMIHKLAYTGTSTSKWN